LYTGVTVGRESCAKGKLEMRNGKRVRTAKSVRFDEADFETSQWLVAFTAVLLAGRAE